MLRTATATLVTAGCIILGACTAKMHTTEAGEPYVYEQPTLASIEKASLDRVWQATQDAIRDLEFLVESKRKDALQAQLTADQVDGGDVRVSLKKLSDSSTRVQIRVGAFGDRGVSELVLTKIRNRIENPRPQEDAGTDAAGGEQK